MLGIILLFLILTPILVVAVDNSKGKGKKDDRKQDGATTDIDEKVFRPELSLNQDSYDHVYNYGTELANYDSKQIKPNCNHYKYKKKNSIMTNAEERCFVRLNKIFGQKFYIVPQVHLSALFDYKVKGQNWKGAFSHINGKSVDFVLINRETFVPVCAVELDDYTHSFGDRKARDDEVERIFENARLPLVRFESLRDKSDKEVVAYFAARINK